MIGRMVRHLTLGLLLLGLVGCIRHERDDGPVPIASPHELVENPRVLLRPDAPIEQLSLRGIRLGDDESNIPSRRVLEKNQYGWISTRDGCRYRILDGKVVTLGLWDKKSLELLGVTKEEEIEPAFGKPERRWQLSPSNFVYHYQDGKKRAIWNTFENRLTTVNVGRPDVEPAAEGEGDEK
jgi:hypothetical protein